MSDFNFVKTGLDGLLVIENFYTGDRRGYFRKSYEMNIYNSAGIEFNTNEIFFSKSCKNVIRGLHFQIRNPQTKIVSVISGRVWDVAVDLRKNSSTYKKWYAVELSEENHKSFFIPKGYAHGFLSLEDDTVLLYQCDGEYNKETDTGILFNCPEIEIKWPIDEANAIISERDMRLMTFDEYENNSMVL